MSSFRLTLLYCGINFDPFIVFENSASLKTGTGTVHHLGRPRSIILA